MKGFYFKKAQYLVDDPGGNVVLLSINYETKSYDIEVLKNGGRDLGKLENEVNVRARDMIRRKSGVNFAQL